MNLQYLNYKVPLTPVENGYGYQGTLGQTDDREKVQCHICGELYRNLGAHVFSSHGVKAHEYRKTFQLGRRTPLCSDKVSLEYKERALKRYARMTPDERIEQEKRMRKAREQTVRVGNPRSLEALNKDGMCPDQLLEKITLLAEKLDHSPSHQEFVVEYGGKYVGAIKRTFGSWARAKYLLGLSACRSGQRVPHNRAKYTDEELLAYLRNYIEVNNTVPTSSDFSRGILPSRHLYRHRFGSIKEAVKLVY